MRDRTTQRERRKSGRNACLIYLAKWALMKAQDCTCPVCGEGLDLADRLNFDHVYPLSLKYTGPPWSGNLVLVHEKCNMDKRNRKPTEEEIAFLEEVNERLGIAPPKKPREIVYTQRKDNVE